MRVERVAARVRTETDELVCFRQQGACGVGGRGFIAHVRARGMCVNEIHDSGGS